MRKFLLLFLFCAPAAFAQNTRYDNIVLSSRGTPVSFATVAVCNQPANVSTQPCSPLATIFSTAAGAAQANPLTADINGNYHFYATPGSTFTVQVFSPQISTPFVMTDISIPVSGSANNNFSGNNTFSGAATFTGTTTAQNFNGALYANLYTGADIHAKLNTLYASLPSFTGKGAAKIVVDPNIGSCYVVSTQLLLNTNGKPVNIDFQGACIDASSMTATDAQVYDWGQGNPNAPVTIANLRLIGPCVTTACAGITSRGIVRGPVNGLVGVTFSNIQIGVLGSVKGFLNGSVNASGNAFLNNCLNCVFGGSNIGMNYVAGGGGDTWTGGSLSQNAIGEQTAASGSGHKYVSTEFDDDTTEAFNRTSAATVDTECIACNFENTSNENPFLVYNDASNGGSMKFIGGKVQNDATTSALNSPYYFNATNALLVVKGLEISSAGQTAVQAFTLGNGTYDLDVSYSGTAPSALFNAGLTGAVRYCMNGGTGATRQCGTQGGYTTLLQGLELGTSLTNGFNFIPASTAALRGVNIPETFVAAVQMAFAVNGGPFTTGHVPSYVSTSGTMQDSGLAIPTVVAPGIIAQVSTRTLKKGSGAGNYTSASTTYVVVDSTNLCNTVTIPTGWKLSVQVSAYIGTNTAVADSQLALTDNAACSTANAGILQESPPIDTTAAGKMLAAPLGWIIAGDGASHSIALQFKTANAADSVILANSSATLLPTMVFQLEPSN